MLFSTPSFLFAFLPITFALYFCAPKLLGNLVLLIISILFYAWGEPFYVLLMLGSICTNYLVGILIAKLNAISKQILFLGVLFNLLVLFHFKYLTFFTEGVNLILVRLGGDALEVTSLPLPIGISFYTFQAIAYIADVYRREIVPQKNPIKLALYIAMFPQLVAGPIVRYQHIETSLSSRRTSIEDFAVGVRRFIAGLAKKVLIADPLGEVSDYAFGMPDGETSFQVAWLGVIAFTLQIYFDFSGYSDMAIGLGRIFGFRYQENFNYPYIATSVRDFWRRWHISLSTWFRDYVYIPLGGNKIGLFQTYRNLLIVFVVTGLWHGASWNFIFWGLFHGVFLVLERVGFGTLLDRIPKVFAHLYVLFVVMIGWILFRAESLDHAASYVYALFGLSWASSSSIEMASVLSHEVKLAFLFGLLFSVPVSKKLEGWGCFRSNAFSYRVTLDVGWCLLAFLCFTKVIASTYSPFIYFRF